MVRISIPGVSQDPGLTGFGSPSAPFVGRSPRAGAVPYSSGGDAGGAIASIAGLGFSISEAAQREKIAAAQRALPAIEADYLKDRAAFRRRIEAGEIPEFADPESRELFYKMDTTLSLQDFADEVKGAIPSLAQAKDENGHLREAPDFDKYLADTWAKYAQIPSFRSDAGSAVFSRVGPGVFADLRSQFTSTRLDSMNVLKREQLVTQGSRVLTGLGAAVGPFSAASGVLLGQEWSNMWATAKDSTLDTRKLQMKAIETALNGQQTPEGVIRLGSLMDRLPIGNTTIGNDAEAAAIVRAAVKDAVEFQNSVRSSRAAEYKDRETRAVTDAENALYPMLSKLIDGGTLRGGAADAVKRFVDQLPGEVRSEFGDEIQQRGFHHIDELLKFRADGAAETMKLREGSQEETYAQILGMANRGERITPLVTQLGPRAFAPGKFDELLEYDAKTQQGLTVLEATTIKDASKAISAPIEQLLTGEAAVDGVVKANVGTQVDAIRDEFYAQALEQARPKRDAQGNVQLAAPTAVQDWINANADKFRARVEDKVRTFRDLQVEVEKALNTAERFRVDAPEISQQGWDRVIPPLRAQQALEGIKTRSNPLNDFGDRELGVLSTEAYRRQIEDVANGTATAGMPPQFSGVIPRIDPSKLEQAYSEFETRYAVRANEERQKAFSEKNAAALGPRLRNAARELVQQIGAKYSPQGGVNVKPADGTKPTAQAAPGATQAAAAPQPTGSTAAAAPAQPPATPRARWEIALDGAQRASAPGGLAAYAESRKRVVDKNGQAALDRYVAAAGKATPELATAIDEMRGAAFHAATKPEPERSRTALSLLSMTGITPEEVAAGKVVVLPPRQLAAQIEASRAHRASGVSPSAADRAMEAMAQPREIELKGALDPWMTDFGLSPDDLATKSARVRAVMASPLVGVPPEQIDTFIEFQKRAMARNGR